MPNDDDLALPEPDALADVPAPARLARRRLKPLFRVVEVSIAGDGRMRRSGQIWHADLDHVRRFGRALAANSLSQQVLVTDAAGEVIERIPVAVQDAPVGWAGWRDMPLPPAPLRKKPRRVPRLPLPPFAPASTEPDAVLPPLDQPPTPAVTRPGPPVDLPVVQAEVSAAPPDVASAWGPLTHD